MKIQKNIYETVKPKGVLHTGTFVAAADSLIYFQIAFSAAAGFVFTAFGTLSAVADFIPDAAARFPQLRISSRTLRHTFRNCGFRPGRCGTLSATADLISIMHFKPLN
ncbi:MAG: hypothetical protein LBK03_06470 [Bacteroidales bacterium]|jgi:acyl-coenzyme A thioesterase PaaI-like protein|nr:hypothetical protein [Bacteroidales bacterium]